MNDRFKFRIRYRCGGCDSINTRYIDWNPLESMINHECEHCMGAAWIEEVLSEEQCTGLRDKNGQLIFEGDILRFYTESEYGDKFYYTKPVVYHSGIALFGFPVTSDGDYKHPIENYANALYQAEWDKEVIGNIHENGDLLN